MFEDKIRETLHQEFEVYGISQKDIEFISELIHYEKEKIKKKEKAFLYQIHD